MKLWSGTAHNIIGTIELSRCVDIWRTFGAQVCAKLSEVVLGCEKVKPEKPHKI